MDKPSLSFLKTTKHNTNSFIKNTSPMLSLKISNKENHRTLAISVPVDKLSNTIIDSIINKGVKKKEDSSSRVIKLLQRRILNG